MQSLQSNPVIFPRVISESKRRTSAFGAWVAGLSAIAGGKSRSGKVQTLPLEFQRGDSTSVLEDELLQLREAKMHAELESKAKSLFIANASHEIRNLLGPVIAYSELLKNESQDPGFRKEILDGISRSSAELMTLVNDLIEMSKIGEGRFEVVKRAFYLRPLVRDVEHFAKREAQKKGLEFRIEISEDVPEQIYSDPCRVKQVLLNLLGNAIKFTESGEVELRVAWDKGNPGNLRFIVRDTGDGMTPDEMGSVFEPFSQCSRSARLRRQGAGLGLAISREIAISLYGDLRILSSQPGQGTTFEFVLFDIANIGNSVGSLEGHPVMEVFKSADAEVLQGKRILIADDAIENVNLISRLLHGSGAKFDTARDGVEAFEKALTSSYDIVLMDIEMPRLNGFEVIRELRSRGYRGHVVALTAHTTEEDVGDCMKAGFTQHLPKPINREQLMRVLSNLVHA